MDQIEQATETLQKLAGSVDQVIKGQTGTIRLLLAALVSGGHVLLEDYPGTGKTTLSKALAASITAQFQRIQFTPDLLPGDIVGVSIFDQNTKGFHFHAGPIFCQILLADEINRASPRTQSALLEAMAEGQVSVEGTTHALDEVFFVIATQNPVEMKGTYPLPEAQMDRFALRLQLGYLDLAGELTVLQQRQSGDPLTGLQACSDVDGIRGLRQLARQLEIVPELQGYIVQLVQQTRRHPDIALGASPRASLTLMKTAQALALYDGTGYVMPDHIQELAIPVLAHRLLLNNEAKFSGRTADGIVQEVLTQVAVPR